MFFLMGCQDEVGGIGESGDHHPSTSNHGPNGTSGLQTSNSMIANTRSNSETGSGFTPEQEASREEDGAWSNVSQITILPDPAFDDVRNNNVTFCRISSRAFSIGIIHIKKVGDFVQMCSKTHHNPYRLAFQANEAERLKHISGKPLPTHFKLISFAMPDIPSLEENKNYLIGVAEYDGEVYDHGSRLEVVPFDPSKESSRVIFSGKLEALKMLGDEHLYRQRRNCSNYKQFSTIEEYRNYFLEGDEFCEQLEENR